MLRIWILRDFVVVLVYLTLTLIMTFPLVLHLTDNQWLAVHYYDRESVDADTYVKLWDVWYLTTQTGNGNSLYHTTEIYYPTGANLVFHNFNVIHTLIVGIFKLITGQAIISFNLAALLTIFLNCYIAYLAIFALLKAQKAAFFAGIWFGLAPWNLLHVTKHPEVMTLFLLPPLIVAFVKAMTGYNYRLAALSGILAGATTYIGLYILGVAGLMMLFIMIALAVQTDRWRRKEFWIALFIVGFIATILILPRLIPIITFSVGVGEALGKYAGNISNDVLDFVVPLEHPVINSLFDGRPLISSVTSQWIYLGLIPLGLAVAGLINSKERWGSVGWLLIALFFMIMVLGTNLRIGGREFTQIPMPRHLLDTILPFPFRVFRDPVFYFIGVMMPFAIAVGIGMRTVLEKIPNEWMQMGALTVLTIGGLFELWTGPLSPMPLKYSPFFDQIANTKDKFALVQIPITRTDSKYYEYVQTIHQHPTVTGIVAREIDQNRDYIEHNPLLMMWYHERDLVCDPDIARSLEQAVKQLASDSVRYVIVGTKKAENFTPYLVQVKPIYQDDLVIVYTIQDLVQDPPCSN